MVKGMDGSLEKHQHKHLEVIEARYRNKASRRVSRTGM